MASTLSSQQNKKSSKRKRRIYRRDRNCRRYLQKNNDDVFQIVYTYNINAFLTTSCSCCTLHILLAAPSFETSPCSREIKRKIDSPNQENMAITKQTAPRRKVTPKKRSPVAKGSPVKTVVAKRRSSSSSSRGRSCGTCRFKYSNGHRCTLKAMCKSTPNSPTAGVSNDYCWIHWVVKSIMRMQQTRKPSASSSRRSPVKKRSKASTRR